MPVPLPTADEVLLEPPSAEETELNARGIASAVAPDGGLTDFQRLLLEAMFPAMTGHEVDLADFEPMTPQEYARAMARRNLAFRTRGVQVMVTCALILRPLPQQVIDRVEEFAHELGVEEGMIQVGRRFAAGSLGLAAIDFERNGYTADWDPEDAGALHTSTELVSAWEAAPADPALAARWAALEDLPEGSLGRMVWEMYRSRGFSFPGSPGSAPPLLAQHDWVHVVADYGTTVESELEVFAFIARANDDMRAFSLLAMVVSLFETGYLRTGAGLFEYDTGHLSAGAEMAVRFADALRRGALGRDEARGSDSIDYLRGVDWFELASLPVDAVRERFRVVPKSEGAVRAGSVGIRGRGSISEFQDRAGRALAEREGRPYESHGAEPA